jgi:hypothetical protein
MQKETNTHTGRELVPRCLAAAMSNDNARWTCFMLSALCSTKIKVGVRSRRKRMLRAGTDDRTHEPVGVEPRQTKKYTRSRRNNDDCPSFGLDANKKCQTIGKRWTNDGLYYRRRRVVE